MDIASKISQAESLLAESLAGLRAGAAIPAEPDVRTLLADFAATVNTAWLQEIADCVIRYLAECDGQGAPPPGPCPLN